MNKARLVDELSKQLDLPKSTVETYLVELVELMSSVDWAHTIERVVRPILEIKGADSSRENLC